MEAAQQPAETTRSIQTILDNLDDSTIHAFREEVDTLVHEVFSELRNTGNLRKLAGKLYAADLRESIWHHARLMESVLSIRNARLLYKSIAWQYRTFLAHGIEPQYFLEIHHLWASAVRKVLQVSGAEDISEIYRLLQDAHDEFMAGGEESEPSADGREQDDSALQKEFLQLLLNSDSRGALSLARKHIDTPEDIAYWWKSIIQSSLYEVGRLWQNGSISVGTEHIATSICQRIVSHFYHLVLERESTKGSLVFSATPRDAHSLGARIMADLLELKGWDVHFTGGNTPTEEIIDLVKRFEPVGLCLSTTFTHNLDVATDTIRSLRKSLDIKMPFVLVGGQAYQADTDLWKTVGADGIAGDEKEADTMLLEARE